ncbi:MAG: type II toxin-antitoxin system PemK/MazF family toxin [Parcubacteria group bacterium]
MKKDFVKWQLEKEIINSRNREIYFRERQIWWCSIGLNIGYEQDGKNERFERPVLILKKFSKDLFWALPTTSQNKTGAYYYQYNYNGRKYSIILSQLRALSSKRLLRKIRKLREDDFEKVKTSVRSLI